jgi:exocyst complex protein 7
VQLRGREREEKMVSAAEAALLRAKASQLREAMRRSEAVREESAAAVASVGGRMAAVDDAVRPAQVRARDRSLSSLIQLAHLSLAV